MTKSNRAARSAVLIIVLSLSSKLLGFVRETLIAAQFGSGYETDTFFVAMTATSLITSLISIAISTTLIPILSEVESKEGKKAKILHTGNITNVIILATILLMILAWLASPWIIRLTARGFEGEQFNLAVELTRIGLPMILFSAVVGVFTGYLRSEERHISSSAIGYPLNFVYIVYLLLMSSSFGIKGLMAAAAVATLAQLFIQIPEAVKAGYRHKFVLNLKDPYVKKVLVLSGPILIGVSINDIGSIVDRTLASSLVSGSISALNYGSRLNTMVLTVFISALTTVIFPLLSKQSTASNLSAVKRIVSRGVGFIMLITIPATVGVIVLARPIVQVAFERGAFTTNDSLMTSQALVFYSIGLIPMSLNMLLTRVFYSLQDTKTPVIMGAVSVGIDIILNFVLVEFMAHSGLALSTSIGAFALTILLYVALRKKIGSLNNFEGFNDILKVTTASVVMGAIARIIYSDLYLQLEASDLNNLIALAIAIIVGALTFFILTYAFGVRDVREATNKLLQRMSRR